jgi:hypothetical protein
MRMCLCILSLHGIGYFYNYFPRLSVHLLICSCTSTIKGKSSLYSLSGGSTQDLLRIYGEIYTAMAKLRILWIKKFWEELFTYFPWYDTGHIENDATKNSSTVACVFVTAVTFLPSRCLAMMRGFLPSRCLATITGFLACRCLATIWGIQTHTHTHTHTHTVTWSHKPTLFFK